MDQYAETLKKFGNFIANSSPETRLNFFKNIGYENITLEDCYLKIDPKEVQRLTNDLLMHYIVKSPTAIAKDERILNDTVTRIPKRSSYFSSDKFNLYNQIATWRLDDNSIILVRYKYGSHKIVMDNEIEEAIVIYRPTRKSNFWSKKSISYFYEIIKYVAEIVIFFNLKIDPSILLKQNNYIESKYKE